MGRRRSLRQAWALVKGAVSAWLDDDAPSMGAALSYYTVFSLAPLLLIVISIAGLMFGTEAVRGEVFGQLNGLMGEDAARAVEGLLAGVSKPSRGIAGSVIGAGVLLIGATTVFGELQNALDRIWRAPARDKSGGLWRLLRTRLLSFGMILGIAFLLMVSLVLGALIAALGRWWGGAFGSWEMLAQMVNTLISFALTSSVFAMIYKLMPRVKVRWHDVLLGAVVTALLFTVGKFLIGLYIGKSAVASSFGAAGSLVIVFIWVYYSAQIFLMGAEFTWVYARTFGSLREPAKTVAGASTTASAASAASAARAAPAVSAAPAAPADLPAPSVMRPVVAASQVARKPFAEVALGIAAMLALRYIVPRLLRRT